MKLPNLGMAGKKEIEHFIPIILIKSKHFERTKYLKECELTGSLMHYWQKYTFAQILRRKFALFPKIKHSQLIYNALL